MKQKNYHQLNRNNWAISYNGDFCLPVSWYTVVINQLFLFSRDNFFLTS